MSQDLSERQLETYRIIRDHFVHHGRAPLLSEIAEALGIVSKGVVHRHVQALAEAGLIELLPGRHRGIRLTDEAPQPTPCTLPLLGRIAAGRPIEAIPGEEQLDLTQFFVGPGRYVLKVQGDSMVEAGILDGDMVIVRQSDRADDGAIVVALIDDNEATLKRLRRNKDGSVTLIPANSALSPMTYPASRVRIQGVLVGQMRSYD